MTSLTHHWSIRRYPFGYQTFARLLKLNKKTYQTGTVTQHIKFYVAAGFCLTKRLVFYRLLENMAYLANYEELVKNGSSSVNWNGTVKTQIIIVFPDILSFKSSFKRSCY